MAIFGQSSSRILCVWLIVAVFSGCSSNPKPDEPEGQLGSSREYEEQALEYMKRAESGSGAIRADALLSAADAWLKANRPEEAAAALKSASTLSRDFHTTGRTRLLSARLAQVRKRPMDVLSALEGLPQPTTPTASRLQIADLRAWALIQKGQGANAARVLSDAAPLMVEGELVRANRKALWEALHIVPDDDLAALAASTHPILGPWAELALLQRTHRGNPMAFDHAFKAWQTRHQLHPVTQSLISELLAQPPPFPPMGPLIPLPPSPPPIPNSIPVPVPLTSATLSAPESTPVPREPPLQPLVPSPPPVAPETVAPLPATNPQSVPNQVALLLPSDGAAAKAANAVRNGFLAAWYASPEKQRPELSFHTFSGGAVRGAYQSAVDGGATLVVGPLAKEEVQSLVKEELAHQTISLNYLPEGTLPPNRLYQFGLSPTDEAKQAAEQAWQEGRTRAFVIAPGGERGDRIVQAFRTKWNTLGGTVLRPLVAENIEEVASALRAVKEPSLQGSAPSTVSPTESKDFVYLSAPPEVSRRLSTLLREVGLTVYASSETLSGNEQDVSLSGFKLLEIPWMLSSDRLRTDLERLQPGEFVTYRRLYALGIDAFRLSEELPRLEADPRTHIDGATGSLSLDSSRRIVRQETWARVVEGRLSPLVSPP